MSKATTTSRKQPKSSHRPALDPEARENQMIALAVNLAEQKLRDGTAATPIITHYLKLATVKEQKELELLDMQKELMKAKQHAIQSSESSEEMTRNAIEAFKTYSGYNGGRIVDDNERGRDFYDYEEDY